MNALLDARVTANRPLPPICEHKKWLDRETALAAISEFPQLDGGIALCLTVYNESAEALFASLVGLTDSIRLLRYARPDVAVSICVLVDGLSTCSSSMRIVLDRFAGPDFLSHNGSQDLACLRAPINLSDLSAFEVKSCGCMTNRVAPAKSSNDSHKLRHGGLNGSEATDVVQLLFAIKRENRGKLDSHWWFYRVFCPHLRPAYCFQMDVGTVPAEHALMALATAFEKDPRVGAVASSIIPPAPPHAVDLLQCWQYISFANSMLLDWPAENAAGYLSVVPGQLSAIRWAAINGHEADDLEDGAMDPLSVYFKGLGPLTPYESMLYAAEDRVLCREIVSNPQVDWTISHVDSALAITDPCSSWSELLRQRKRWCNGYTACRVNFIKRLPAFIADPTVTARRKTRSATAGIYHSAMLVNDWLITAISVVLQYSLANHAASLMSRWPWASSCLKVSFCAAMFALIVQFVICYQGSLSLRRVAFFRFSIALQGSVFAISLGVSMLYGRAIELILGMSFLLAVLPSASLMGHRQQIRALVTSMPIVVITGCVVSPLIWMYAVCNVHDSSWGTKGLVADVRHPRRGVVGTSERHKAFRRFRSVYLSAWIASNLCFVYICDQWFGSNHLRAVIALQSVSLVIMLFGLICRVSARQHFHTGAIGDRRHRRVIMAARATSQTVRDSRAQPH
jgi:cellulose synthase/poly-beta-1,6-N-acetylglucosamine synthase-like glycosyltransferase